MKAHCQVLVFMLKHNRKYGNVMSWGHKNEILMIEMHRITISFQKLSNYVKLPNLQEVMEL